MQIVKVINFWKWNYFCSFNYDHTFSKSLSCKILFGSTRYL